MKLVTGSLDDPESLPTVVHSRAIHTRHSYGSWSFVSKVLLSHLHSPGAIITGLDQDIVPLERYGGKVCLGQILPLVSS